MIEIEQMKKEIYTFMYVFGWVSRGLFFSSSFLILYCIWHVQQHVTPPSCISPSYPNNELSQNFKAAINSIKVPPVNSTPNLVKSNTNKGMSFIIITIVVSYLCVFASIYADASEYEWKKVNMNQ